ncbi:ANTH domain-containing protein [Gorgonomyces haynaldii]|nr:ANTH domain-containing protein [Gorgonomyces haynaldii]
MVQLAVANTQTDNIGYAIQRLMTDESRAFKEKHVNLIVQVTYQQDYQLSELFVHLSSHQTMGQFMMSKMGVSQAVANGPLHSNNWILVFKALSLIHVLIRDGNSPRIMAFLSLHQNLVNVSDFPERANIVPGSKTKDLLQYGVYLQDKIAVYKASKMDLYHPDAKMHFKDPKNVSEFLKNTLNLQKLIESGCECKWVQKDLETVPVIQQAYRMIVLDMLLYFGMANEALISIVKQFYGMDQSDKEQALSVYKNFEKHLQKTIDFFTTSRSLATEWSVDIPEFQMPNMEFLETMHKHLASES